MLDEILSQYKPHTWTSTNYNNRRYALVQINSNSNEYSEVTAPFRRYGIERVERVQNPYALGYFMLRKKQLSGRGQTVYEVRRYHPVNYADKEAALEYNLDVRKYAAVRLGNDNFTNTFLELFQSTPQFYASVESLVARYDTFIVCKVLVDVSNQNISVIEPSRESEYMPEYVVKISNN